MTDLTKYRTIELAPENGSNPQLSTDYLFGEARGKMFGVLICSSPAGGTHILKAFSGQYNGLWHVPGWAPPLFDLKDFQTVHDAEEKKIKQITTSLKDLSPHSTEWKILRQQRRQLSQKLMQDLFHLYRLTNFAGKTASLFEAFNADSGIPTGTGDCCAPKLLNQAAVNNLTPIGLAEFYWGMKSKSGNRTHGDFYPSCTEKCQPLLGFLLCGLGNQDEK